MSEWRARTLGELLAAAPPDAEALVTPTRRLTYGELCEAARRVARALRALGIGRGDRVAIGLESDERWLALFCGAALLGTTTMPLGARHAGCQAMFLPPGARRGRQVPVGARVIVPGQASWDAFAALDRGQDVSEEAEPGDVLLVQPAPGGPAAAKDAMLTHDSALHGAWAAGARIGMRSTDRYFSAWPLHAVEGSVLSALMAMAHGACLVLLPEFDEDAALRVMETERCTLLSGNGEVLKALAARAGRARRNLVLRGGWTFSGPEAMRCAVRDLGATQMCAGYGLAEASASVAMSDWRDPEALRLQGLATPLEGLHLRTVQGEIQVRGWSVMRGYDGDAAATARAFTPDGFLRTGDLGEVHPGGRLRALGRA